jgi:hypothetical protein
MNTTVLEGVLKPDGTLEFDCKPELPPGPVRVTLEALPHKPSLMYLLEQIWAERESLGMTPRTPKEIDAEIRELRAEWDEEDRLATK